MKKNIVLAVLGIVIFVIGFIVGEEYKTVQIKNAFNAALNNDQLTSSTTTINREKPKDQVIISKNVGENVVLATQTWKVISSKEQQSISNGYGTPKVAKEGAKFVVINMDVTNTTNSEFLFEPGILEDNTGRQFSTYSDSIGGISNYLNMRTLSPSIKANGNLVYEIPSDATGYSLIEGKSGTNEVYKILIK